MDLLLDIIKFLKKLQNGQQDIEAGQFELYEGMENVNKALNELKLMKKDVDDMKTTNAEQIQIIKDLEVKLDKLQKEYGAKQRVKNSSTTYLPEGICDTISKKGIKKIHRRIEEVVDITSDVSNENWNSDETESQEDDEQSWTEKNSNPQAKTPEKSCVSSEKKKRTHRCKNSEMLQRYLQDSIKYRDRRVSYSTDEGEVQTRPSVDPFWEETNWEESNGGNWNCNEANPGTSKAEKSFCCPICCKKFAKANDYSIHRKKHEIIRCRYCRKGFTNKQKLNHHLALHKNKPRNFEGFTCCYCHLVCSTPEKLTAHLRKCRIITKTSR